MFVFLTSWAEIREINDLFLVKDYVAEMAKSCNKIMVVWDIDETIFTVDGMYGGEKWFRHEVTNHIKKGNDATRAIELVVPEYYHAQNCIQVRPMQEDVAKIIAELQDDGHFVCALTSRGPLIAMRTQQLLESLAIDFNRSCPIEHKEDGRCFVWRGVIYGGSIGQKGKIFTDFLDVIQQHNEVMIPSVCIFINDKYKYVEMIETALQEQYPTIQFCGFWYNAENCSASALSFCPLIAEQEKRSFLQEKQK